MNIRNIWMIICPGNLQSGRTVSNHHSFGIYYKGVMVIFLSTILFDAYGYSLHTYKAITRHIYIVVIFDLLTKFIHITVLLLH